MQVRPIARRSDATIVEVCGRSKLRGHYFIVEPPNYVPNGKEISSEFLDLFLTKYGYEPVVSPSCKSLKDLKADEDDYRRPLFQYFNDVKRQIEHGHRITKTIRKNLDRYPTTVKNPR